MKKIIGYLSEHFKEEFNLTFFSLFLILVFGSVVFQYQTDFDYNFWNSPYRYLLGFAFYAFPMLLVAFLYAFTHSKPLLFQIGFWFNIFVIAFALFGLHYLIFYWDYIRAQPEQLHKLLGQVFFNSHTIIWYLLPALAYWLWVDKINKDSFYGLTLVNFDWKTYAVMLAITVPFIAWASFRQDFLEMYPRYKPSGAESYLALSYSITFAIHAFFYLAQFLALEVFFRGFIVLSLSRYMGGGAIWVMVFAYVLIHFGKPWPETVSSAYGGYVLGVLALKTRSVMGGVFIHGGVAILMEFFAYLQLFIFEH